MTAPGMGEVFLGVVTSPTEHPHFLCHAGLGAEAGHFRACEPPLAEVGSQAPALHAGVHDGTTFRVLISWLPH